MKDKGIPISPKHGLNPSITRCPICHKEMGLALLGKLKGDAEAPKYLETELCDECKKKYSIVLEMNLEAPKPKPTGRCVYILKETLDEKFRDKEHLYMEDTEFEQLLKQINQNGQSN